MKAGDVSKLNHVTPADVLVTPKDSSFVTRLGKRPGVKVHRQQLNLCELHSIRLFLVRLKCY